MMDYGEFVPDALKTSVDQDFRALGQRMDLVEPEDDYLVETLMKGKYAIIESYAYLV